MGFKNWSILRTNSTDRLREMRMRVRGVTSFMYGPEREEGVHDCFDVIVEEMMAAD